MCIRDRQYAELVGAVVRQLPHDIDPTTAQGWIENQEALQRALRGALMPSSAENIENIFAVEVNYDQTVGEMIKAGKYDWKNFDINSQNFPVNHRQRGEMDIYLVHFDRLMEFEGVIPELDKLGLRPGELPELLAFGAKYPDVQRRFPIVALGSVWLRRFPIVAFGSVWRNPVGDRLVPYLCRRASERDLGLFWFVGTWPDFCRFAAVRT